MTSPEDLDHALAQTGVRDERVLQAVRATPRAAYVPDVHRDLAYIDEPIPIEHDQVTTQPSLTARMIESLALAGDAHVLEIGTGHGFQTAILACLAGDVVGVELWPDTAQRARDNLARQGVANVTVLTGDGSRGAPEHAPFDAILVSAAFPSVPPLLVEQLRPGGRLVQPIGPGGHEDVTVFPRTATGLGRGRVITAARFVRLHGEHGYPSPPGL